MAKKKGKLKKTPSVKKAKKVSARKAEPKKKAKAVPTGKAKATPKKKPQVIPAKKVKTTPKKKAKAVSTSKAKVVPKTQLRKKAAARKAPKKLPTKKPPTNAPQDFELVAKMPGGGPVVAEKPVTYPNLRRRVGELLDKLNDSALQWLHFEITEGATTTAQQAEEAAFPPLDRPALIQDLTTIAVDEFQLADDPDLAERIKDENSIRLFLSSKKKGKPSKDQGLLFPE